jgi:hypothetical protein
MCKGRGEKKDLHTVVKSFPSLANSVLHWHLAVVELLKEVVMVVSGS